MFKKVLIITLLLGSGCQMMQYQPYAKDVKKKPNQGGIIAMRSNYRDEDRAKAEAMMQKNCSPIKPSILEEGEIVVGQTTATTGNESFAAGSQGKEVGSFLGMPVVSGAKDPSKSISTNSTVSNVTEWQIQYKCVK